MGFHLDVRGRVAAFMNEDCVACLRSQEAALLHAIGRNALDDSLSKDDFLNLLSQLLLRPCVTIQLARHFRPLLVDLCGRWVLWSDLFQNEKPLIDCPVHGLISPVKVTCASLEAELNARTASFGDAKKGRSAKRRRDSDSHLIEDNPPMDFPYSFIEASLDAFANLIPMAPQVKGSAIALFSRFRSLLQTLNSVADQAAFSSLVRVLRNAYRISRHVPELYLRQWSKLHAFNLSRFRDSSPWARAYAMHLFVTIFGLPTSDAERLFYDESTSQEAAAKILPPEDFSILRLVEDEYDANLKLLAFLDGSFHSDELGFEISTKDLCKLTADIGGVLLHRNTNHGQAGAKPLISTPTTLLNMRRVGLAISLGLPILLEGTPGVGKTALLEEAARLYDGKDVLKVHLGDQTDSKVLLGTYVCQSEPGSFRWQPGVLTRAVQEGRWILIEDIDKAPTEVLSVLLPLLERRTLFISTRGEELPAKEGFQLFATRTIWPHGRSSQFDGVGTNLWNILRVEELDPSEISLIIDGTFPSIRSLSSDLMNSYNHVSALVSSFPGQRRTLCLRDLFKWCRRVNRSIGKLVAGTKLLHDLELATREEMFLDASDCFTLMLSRPEYRFAALSALAQTLAIPENRLDFFVHHYLPKLSQNHMKVLCGRGCLQILGASQSIRAPVPNFALTSTSARLLETLSVGVSQSEPLLLIGESGTGKTTAIQYLARACNQKLHVINLSQQTETSDLIGGFKPVEANMLAFPVLEKFNNLFGRTFSMESNSKFLQVVRSAALNQRWDAVVSGFNNAVKMAEKVLKFSANGDQQHIQESAKRSKRLAKDPSLVTEWIDFKNRIQSFSVEIRHAANSFLFSFIEGTLTRAVKTGDWILLDEINLASAETLESLSSLLQDQRGSLLLLERGDMEVIPRHSNFRLFACMNPANDAGKRDLPASLQSRFTEVWVESPDKNTSDLNLIIERYLRNHLPSPLQGGNEIITDIAELHSSARLLSDSGKLLDGAGQKAYISVRTLSRALSYAAEVAAMYGLRRGLYDGFQMMYMSMLHKESINLVGELVDKHILSRVRNQGSFLSTVPKQPATASDEYVLFRRYWLKKGPIDSVDVPSYVLTPSVESNLISLARAVMLSKFPVLIQGPTSAGKTSMIEYLAKRTGHQFVRVNNHEHTDLQEYIGSYRPNAQGKLIFQEGVLVQALRHGHWIVLDELNLAPTDVLEALNRLLDDNRELFVPETQEVVRPHPSFMLFATQNPPGVYGGRKQLSRAFRSRFIELNYDDIPESELGTILEKRCLIAPSYAAKIVAVYKSLSFARQRSRIFEGKNAFATLRDLFRWGNRRADSWEKLAEDGYMLLAERSRREDEKMIVKEVLETSFRLKLDPAAIYEKYWNEIMSSFQEHRIDSSLSNVVWTKAMKRLFVLVMRCVQHKEPVILVGETGCGKTTICQIVAALTSTRLHIVNAHAGSETGDFLGSMRPARGRDSAMANLKLAAESLLSAINKINSNEAKLLDVDITQERDLTLLLSTANKLKSQPSFSSELSLLLKEAEMWYSKSSQLFEWVDGPLVQAMRDGERFLLDEISLAEDSVLERLNSVLEPERTLLLAEKGAVLTSNGTVETEKIIAAESFSFFATMNPGGDYGKKELSPALRNRFTEIWASASSDREDLQRIVCSHLADISFSPDFSAERIATSILDFIEWLATRVGGTMMSVISLRDVVAWASFISKILSTSTGIRPQEAVIHGGCMVLIDSIATNPMLGARLSDAGIAQLRSEALKQLSSLVGQPYFNLDEAILSLSMSSGAFGIGPFALKFGNHIPTRPDFAFQAPSTLRNVLRILRGLSLQKPILLEGPPGVGKTTLVASLADVTGHRLCRINLSEQTDLMDLFGSDLPVEGGFGGEFAWRDGPFLDAMKKGDWVLLDELNLASQQVLEGLNACLDHRSVVFIPELDRSFDCHPDFRVFAAQNPQSQGGGRKGLPKSFVNRFIQVYAESMSPEDLIIICEAIHPDVDKIILQQMIEFNTCMHLETSVIGSFAASGRPWEFNLRDVSRWAQCLSTGSDQAHPGDFLDFVYTNRMRSTDDRQRVIDLYRRVFHADPTASLNPPVLRLTEEDLQIGKCRLRRSHRYVGTLPNGLRLLQSNRYALEALAKCVEMKTPALLVGSSGSGKSSLVRSLSYLIGQPLKEFALNSGVDALELLGSFEQVDLNRDFASVKQFVTTSVTEVCRRGESKNSSTSESFAVLMSNFHTFEHETSLNIDTAVKLLDLLSFFPSFEFSKRIPDYKRKLDSLRLAEKNGTKGRFEWVDGALIKAAEEGCWLLIDNVNLCSSSVLDRLNSLLEPNGTLILSERGLVNGAVKVVSPHPDFRLFMTMDPRFGEISRAMRNRSVEIYIPELAADTSAPDSENDVVDLMNSIGLLGFSLPIELRKHLGGDRRLEFAFGRLIREQIERGVDLTSALTETSAMFKVDTPMDLVQAAPCSPIDAETIRGWPISYSTDAVFSDFKLSEIVVDVAFVGFSHKSVLAFSDFDKSSMETMGLLQPSHKTQRNMADSKLHIFLLKHLHDPVKPIAWLKNREKYGSAPARNLYGHCAGVMSDLMTNVKPISFSYDPVAAEPPVLDLYFSKNASSSAQVKLSIAVAIRKHLETALRESCRQKASESMNLLEQSIAFAEGCINDHDVNHGFVKFVGATFPEIRKILSISAEAIPQHDLLSDLAVHLLNLYDSLWDCLEKSSPSDLSEVAFTVLSMISVLHSIKTLHNEVDWPALSQCAAYLHVEKLRTLSNLWRNTRASITRTVESFNLKIELQALGQCLQTQCATVEGAIFHNASELGTELRASVVDALATLHTIGVKDASLTSKLFEVLQKVPQEIKPFVDRGSSLRQEVEMFTESFPEISIPIKVKSKVSKHISNLCAQPLTDIRVIRNVFKLIASLSQLSRSKLQPLETTKALALKASSAINDVIEAKFLNPCLAEPLRRAVWILEGAEDPIDRRALASLVNETLFFWHSCLWSNSFHLWKSRTAWNADDIVKNFFFQEPNAQPRVQSRQNCALGAHQSVDTKIFLSFMRGLEALPLLALEEEKTVIERFAKVRRARNSAISDEVTLLFFEIRQIFEGFELCTTILPYLDILADLAKDVLSGNRALSGVDVDESLSSVQNELRVLPLPSRVGEMLSALLRSVAQMFSDEFSHHSRGKGWMMASAVFVELYVPETFFDPAAEAAVLFKSKLRQSECLFSDFLAAKHYTASVLGCQSSLPLVRERLLALTADCKQIELQTAYRPQRSQLGEVMRDLSHLKSMICAREGERTIVELDNIPSEQVDFLQDALQSFIDRTWKKFPAYQDLLLPALGAAFHMKYGLALTSQREGLSLQFEKILEDLLTFFDAGTEHFERHILLLDSIMLKDGISEFSVLVGKTALALLSRLAWKAKVSGLPSQRLNSLFHSIADLLYKWWSAWTENVRKDEEDQATLYKYKERKFDVSSETEIEEAELTETFPSYREEIENDEALKVEKDARLSPKEFAETLPQEVAEMHLLFVKAMHGREPCTEEAIWYSTAWKAFKTAALVSSHVEHSLSTELDWKSSQSIEFMARTCFAQFDKSAYAVFDIYKDPNTGEVAALLSILEQTQEIAMLILSQFPEHSVARDIASLCSRIASFPTSAPMMKYLTAAELLLLKCNEWERYASRELSMKSCISQLTGLSVKWRGIELQSWSVLLRIEEQKFASKSNALWFNLWSTLGSVAQSDSKESEKEVISVLDQFVLGSAMGEFDYRLSILLTFYNDPYLQSISNGPKIRSILYNIHSYYSQFLPQVKEHILQRKGPIQKELIEFTKIASWKDINVLALKESARRSHYQLAKFMRKYREILSGPVSTVILTIRQTLPESALTGAKTKEYASLTALAGSILEQRPVQSVQRYNSEQRGKRLKSIGVLLMKSHDFLKTAILDNACCNEAINIDDFAQAIIERCESFQKAEDVKGAKSIRRRAFTDLFKFLEYLGVSTRSSPLHESVRDYTFLMGHSGGFASLEGVPLFAQDSLNSATILLVERAEFQYFKLLSRISLTRELAMKSSRDLTERDVERCISSIDYLMVTIIGLRDVLSLVSQSLVDPIFQEYDHLCSSVEADQIVRDLTLAPSGAILSTLTSQKEWVDRTIGVITQIRVFLRELGMSDMLTRDINVLHADVVTFKSSIDGFFKRDGRELQSNAAMVSSMTLTAMRLQKEELARRFANCLLMLREKVDVPLVRVAENRLNELTEPVTSNPNLPAAVEPLIDRLLICMQNFRLSPSESEWLQAEADNEFDLHPNTIPSMAALFKRVLGRSNVQLVAESLREVVALYSSQSFAGATPILVEIKPLFDCVFHLLRARFYEFVRFYKSICKLSIVLANTFASVLKDGFCVPDSNETSTEDGQNESNGTGLGSGEGDKNISDNVESDEELEDTKAKNQPQPEESGQQPDPKDDKAIETDAADDGNLEDVQNENGQDEEEESADEDEQDLDEEMGQLKSDEAEAVDEKLWNEEESKDSQTDMENKGPDKGDKTESELVAKEDRGHNPPPPKSGEDNESMDEDEGEDKGEIDDENKDNQEASDAEEEPQTSQDPNQMELTGDGNEFPEIEELELPDDMNLDGDTNENAEEIDNTEDADNPDPSEVADEEGDDQTMEPNEAEKTAESGETMEELAEDEDKQPLTSDGPEPAQNQPGNEEEENSARSHNDGGTQAGKESQENNQDPQSKPKSEPNETSDEAEKGPTGLQDGDAGDDQGRNKEGTMDGTSAEPDSRANPNPLRDLADAEDRWISRLSKISDASNAENAEKRDSALDSGTTYEFIQQGDENFDGRALGTASENQQKDAEEKGFLSNLDTELVDALDSTQADDHTNRSVEDQIMEEAAGQNEGPNPANAQQNLDEDSSGSNQDGDAHESDTPMNDEKVKSSKLHTIEDVPIEDADDLEEVRKSLAEMTATFRESTFDHEEAVKLWRAYSTATRELSFALCESLRLILEPTLATKMRGDYRTGKRLNMRKVIPYIASEFKKDKIWLRRTKPSKRTYQILIAIDDSRSMAESQSVELAYESIALITKAFEQLEVGQVAVASFGGNMQLLHHFETPLSDDAGGKIFEKFTFDQTSTNVLQLMDSSIKMLSDARNFAANTGRDMWQLEIVLSDGIMDNHKNVRQFVRVAMQKQIMTVFIVLDRRNERDSILKMSSVSYETDASGRPSLKMTPYISTFPFDFFIVLQDISQLPNVLSETLRQYLQVTSS